jgi:hypothetical protein
MLCSEKKRGEMIKWNRLQSGNWCYLVSRATCLGYKNVRFSVMLGQIHLDVALPRPWCYRLCQEERLLGASTNLQKIEALCWFILMFRVRCEFFTALISVHVSYRL